MTPNDKMYGDNKNSTNVPLAAGGEWIGEAREMTYSGVIVTMLSDVDGTLFMEFSTDGINWDNSRAYDFDGGVDEVHRETVIAKFYRTRYVNNGTNQTFLRLQTSYDNPALVSNPLNSILQQDADAIAVREFPPDLEIANGRFQGTFLVNKFGKNSDVDTGSLPEDILEGGGVYAGFPVPEVAEEFEILCAAGDVGGTVRFSYLADSTSTAYTTAVVVLTGTSTPTGVSGIRSHTMRFDTGNDTDFNVGVITLRHITTTANVFLTIAIGRSQSNYSVYTIPQDHTGFIQRIHGSVRGGNNTTVDGALWFRVGGQSPRLRRPYTIGLSSRLDDNIYGGLPVPAGSDIAMRITATSGNNIEVSGGFDIVVLRNP